MKSIYNRLILLCEHPLRVQHTPDAGIGSKDDKRVMIGICPHEAQESVSSQLLYDFSPFSYFPLSDVSSKPCYLGPQTTFQLDLRTEDFPAFSSLRLVSPQRSQSPTDHTPLEDIHLPWPLLLEARSEVGIHQEQVVGRTSAEPEKNIQAEPEIENHQLIAFKRE